MNILCYGDSNTWGFNTEQSLKCQGGQVRFPKEVRWTGILQKHLGEACSVIEEGLCGRTTVFEDPLYMDRKGIDYVRVVFESHLPLDAVVLMLGTNDFKEIFHAKGETSALGIKHIVELFQELAKEKGIPGIKILIVSPIQILPAQNGTYMYGFVEESEEHRKVMEVLCQEIAENYGCLYLKGAEIALPCKADGIHLDAEGHRKIGEMVVDVFKKYEFVQEFQK